VLRWGRGGLGRSQAQFWSPEMPIKGLLSPELLHWVGGQGRTGSLGPNCSSSPLSFRPLSASGSPAPVWLPGSALGCGHSVWRGWR
jgi:hypothetical protein